MFFFKLYYYSQSSLLTRRCSHGQTYLQTGAPYPLRCYETAGMRLVSRRRSAERPAALYPPDMDTPETHQTQTPFKEKKLHQFEMIFSVVHHSLVHALHFLCCTFNTTEVTLNPPTSRVHGAGRCARDSGSLPRSRQRSIPPCR